MTAEVRQFRILNADNQFIDLLSLDNFAHNPEGLGLDLENTFYQSFNTYADVAKASKQAQIKFDIIFGFVSKKAYFKYNQVLLFLNVGGLKLEYTIPDVGTFIRDVTIESLSKTEKDEYNVLQETLTVQAITPWYSWIQLTQAFDPVINAGIIYDDTIENTMTAAANKQVGLQYNHKAYAWSSNGKTRFTRRFPNINMLKGTRGQKTFNGKGSPLPSTWYQLGGTDLAEVVNVYDHPLISAAVLVKTQASPGNATGVMISQDGTEKPGDKFVLSYYVKNTGMTEIKLVDRIALFRSDYSTMDIPRADGQPNETYTIPADGNWHLVRGTDHKIPDGTDTSQFQGTMAFAASGQTNVVASSTFLIGLPKLEINDVATPWLPSEKETTELDYPTYVGEMRTTDYNDTEDKTLYDWKLRPRDEVMDWDMNHANLDKAYIHTAFSWSADGVKGFCQTLPKDNLWDEANTVTGYVVTANGQINSSGVTANHQTMKDLQDLLPGTTAMTLSIYNPSKKAQVSTNSNRVGCFDGNGKYIKEVTMPKIDGTALQMYTFQLPAGTKKVRLGVIHGFNTEKDTTLKFKFEEGESATPYIPYWGNASFPNLLIGTGDQVLTVSNAAGDPEVVTSSFKLFEGTFAEHFKAGDKVVFSADFFTQDSTGAKGTLQARIKGSAGSEFEAFEAANFGTGRFAFSYTIRPEDVVYGSTFDSIELIGKDLKTSTTITVKEIKMERDFGNTIYLYRKAVSEDPNTDYPCYVGRYAKSDDDTQDSPDPTLYHWTLMEDLFTSDFNNTVDGIRLENMVDYVGSKQFQAQPGTNITSSLKVSFKNGKPFGHQYFKENGTLVVSFDWEVIDPTGTPAGHFNPQLTQNPWALNDQLYDPIYPSPNNLSGRYIKGCILDAGLVDPSGKDGIDFAFRMDNMKDTSNIVISNFTVEYFPPEINYFHYAFAWDDTGTDRFTSSFPKYNLIENSRLSGAEAVTNDSGIEFMFDNELTLTEQDISIDDWLIISFDYSATDTANHFSGRFIPTFDLAPLLAGNTKYVNITAASHSGHYEAVIPITQDMTINGMATKMKIIYESMDETVTVTVDNFKMETIAKEDEGYELKATQWMPAESELLDTDYPSFLGVYTDDTPLDSSDYTKYTWTALTDWGPEAGNQTVGDLQGDIAPYRIIYNDTTVYQADYSKSASFLVLHNDSLYFGTQTDSSLRITIKATTESGPLVNPSWYITDTNGNTLQTEAFLTTIPVGFDLIVSSDSFERKMVIHDPTGELPDKEIDDLINPAATGWMRVPVGESRIVLSPDLYTSTGGFNGGRITVEFKKEWLVV